MKHTQMGKRISAAVIALFMLLQLAPAVAPLAFAAAPQDTSSVVQETSSSTPQEETSSVPQQETSSAPQEETGSVPQEETSSTAQEETSSVPQEETSSTAQGETAPAGRSVPNLRGAEPRAAHAAHCVCGGAVNAGDHTSHTNISYTAFTQTTGGKLAAGNYYLTANTTLDQTLTIEGSNTVVNLCLNGFTLTVKEEPQHVKLLEVTMYGMNGALSICDCSAAQTGTLKGGSKSFADIDMRSDSGDIINFQGANNPSGSLNLYSGTLTNGISRMGGAVYCNSRFNMYGGKISGNYAVFDGGDGYGGGVFLASGAEFKMYGGEISGNTSGIRGGGVSAGADDNGIAITILGLDGNVPKIINNKSGDYNIAATTTTPDPHAKGGGVNLAVSHDSDKPAMKMVVGGTVQITGNTYYDKNKVEQPSNVYIHKSNRGYDDVVEIDATHPLTAGTSIGLSKHDQANGLSSGLDDRVVSGDTNDFAAFNAGYFFSDDTTKQLAPTTFPNFPGHGGCLTLKAKPTYKLSVTVKDAQSNIGVPYKKVTLKQNGVEIATQDATYDGVVTFENVPEGEKYTLYVAAATPYVEYTGAEFSVTAATSKDILLVKGTPPTITTQPEAKTYAAKGAAVSLSAAATGPGTLTYQWQTYNKSTRQWTDISGAQAAAYTPPTTTVGTETYRCKVSTAYGETLTGEAVVDVGTAPTYSSASFPSIGGSSQEPDNSPKTGETVYMMCHATGHEGSDEGKAVTYQWQVSTDGGVTFADVTEGTSGNASHYYIPPMRPDMSGNQYRCVVSNKYGSFTPTETDKFALLRYTSAQPVFDKNNTTIANAGQYLSKDNHPTDGTYVRNDLNPNLAWVDFPITNNYAPGTKFLISVIQTVNDQPTVTWQAYLEDSSFTPNADGQGGVMRLSGQMANQAPGKIFPLVAGLYHIRAVEPSNTDMGSGFTLEQQPSKPSEYTLFSIYDRLALTALTGGTAGGKLFEGYAGTAVGGAVIKKIGLNDKGEKELVDEPFVLGTEWKFFWIDNPEADVSTNVCPREPTLSVDKLTGTTSDAEKGISFTFTTTADTPTGVYPYRVSAMLDKGDGTKYEYFTYTGQVQVVNPGMVTAVTWDNMHKISAETELGYYPENMPATMKVTTSKEVPEDKNKTFQWQKWSGTQWQDIVSATASTYTIPGNEVQYDTANGTQYRCKIVAAVSSGGTQTIYTTGDAAGTTLGSSPLVLSVRRSVIIALVNDGKDAGGAANGGTVAAPKVGNTLSLDYTPSSGSAIVTPEDIFSYTWETDIAQMSNTGKTYQTQSNSTTDDVGRVLKVTATVNSVGKSVWTNYVYDTTTQTVTNRAESDISGKVSAVVTAIAVTNAGSTLPAAQVGDVLTATCTSTGVSPDSNVSFQWQYSTDGTTWENIFGETAKTYTITGAVRDMQLRAIAEPKENSSYLVESGDASAPSTVASSATDKVTHKVTGVTIADPAGASYVPTLDERLDAQVALNPADSATPTGTYQWQYDANGSGTWTNISSATSATYTPVEGDGVLGKKLRVQFTPTAPFTSSPSPLESAASQPVKKALTSVTLAGASTPNLLVGDTLTATVLSQADTTTMDCTFIWYAGSNPISGQTGPTLIVAEAQRGQIISVQATAKTISNYNGTVTSADVGPAKQTVTGVTTTGGTDTRTAAAATVVPTGATVNYQWYRTDDANDTTGGTLISGATGKDYYPGADEVGKYLYVIINGYGDYVGTQTSTPPIPSGGVLGVVTGVTLPSDGPAVGAPYTATLQPAGADVTWKWEIETSPGTGSYTTISGATDASYTPAPGDVGKKLKVTATGTGNWAGSNQSATSATVKTALTGVTLGTNAPDVGTEITTTLEPTGATGAYKWYHGDSVTGPWTVISGGTSEKYTPALTDVGKYLRVEITGSGSYTGTVQANTTGIVTKALVSATLNGGAAPDTATALSVTVDPAAAQTKPSVTYQWYRTKTSGDTTGGTQISGAAGSNYTPGVADIGFYVYAKVTGTDGYTGTVTTACTTLPVAGKVGAVTLSTSDPVVGQPITATAAPAGATVTWQWFYSDNTSISNATGASYTPVAADAGKQIYAKATGTGSYSGSSQSPTTQAVASIPAFTQQPAGATANVINTPPVGATFTAAANGSPTPTYQWQVSKDGGATWTDVAGATNTSYTTPAANAGLTLAQSGEQYRCVATNRVGSATSNPATLTVEGDRAYHWLSGENGVYTKASGAGLAFRSDDNLVGATLSDFENLYIDGVVVGRANYTLTEGSVIATLNPAYLESLSLGKHRLVMAYHTAGAVATVFTIGQPAPSTQTPSAPAPGASAPSTPTPCAPEDTFWTDVHNQIHLSANGSTVTVDAGNRTMMPGAIINDCIAKNVTLVIHWAGGKTLTLRPGSLRWTNAEWIALRGGTYKNPTSAAGRKLNPFTGTADGRTPVLPKSNAAQPAAPAQQTGAPLGALWLLVVLLLAAGIVSLVLVKRLRENKSR